MPDVLDRLIVLTQGALDEFGSQHVPLSASLNKAIRIAVLRNDYLNVYWLREETLSFDDEDAIRRLREEMRPHFSQSDYIEIRGRNSKAYMSERHVRELDDQGQLRDRGNLCGLSIVEIEHQAQAFRAAAERAVTPTGLHPIDLYFVDQANVKVRGSYTVMAREYEAILARVGARVHGFLEKMYSASALYLYRRSRTPYAR